jgi:hypothetical protein
VALACISLVVLALVVGLFAGTAVFFALGGICGLIFVAVEQWTRSGSR